MDNGPMWRYGMSEEEEIEQLAPYTSEELDRQYDHWYQRGFSGEAMRRWREIQRRRSEEA